MNIKIKEENIADSKTISSIVMRANIPVAKRFGITKLNAPKHPSNCTTEWIEEDINRGVDYFAAEIDDKLIGCIAFEKAEDELAYLNRLAVLPEYQNNGIGRELVDFHLIYSKKHKIKNVSIGIINEHTELKNWYTKLGFIETEIKHFSHLPFTVCLMNYKI